MLDYIDKLNKGDNSFSKLLSCVRRGVPSAVFGVPDSFRSLIISQFSTKTLLVVKDMVVAENYRELLSDYCNKKIVILPPKDEILRVIRAFSKDICYKRLYALSEIEKADIVITTIDALSQPVPNKIEKLRFVQGQEMTRDEFLNFLISNGYNRCEQVEERGSFSLFGDALEIFAVNLENPIHIDFFGDEIEKIKFFDIEDHQTLALLKSVEVIQAVENKFTQDEFDVIVERAKEFCHNAQSKKDKAMALRDDIMASAEKKDYDFFSFACSISNRSAFLCDILNQDTVVVFDEAKMTYDYLTSCENEFEDRYKLLLSACEILPFEHDNMFSLEFIKDKLSNFSKVAFSNVSSGIFFFEPLEIIRPQVSAVVDYRLDYKEIFFDIKNWLKSNYIVQIFTDGEKRETNFGCELSNNGISYQDVKLNPKKLKKGFIFHEEKMVVIGSGNLFSRSDNKPVKRSKKQTFFSAPEKGDYAVHETHGIGRVIGDKKLSTSEGTKEYIAIEYAGGDILYVPVEKLDVLTRYVGSDKKPKLSKIGGDFERVKSRVKESIKKMSFDLKKLYSERNQLNGIKFKVDVEMQKLFEDAFGFEDTPDQITATEEIKNDMICGKVMDRLVCGDVGFGKTEVAFRAVFLAVSNGFQVAMLAPTTILTEQHYQTAFKRFKDFGIRVAVLNRFKTDKQQKKILEDLKSGKIDFVIGTHRLLSSDIEFKNLGLLVLDEEQRFGVEHKEKIKLLKKNIDTLTLSATPIPRTLHMSLTGIRPISTINTPPASRLPVQVYVIEQTDSLIIDAITRELNRGGGVFILYNRVESIDSFAKKVSNLVPSAKITVAHGQMEERKLEKNILEFYEGETDVLISTTIIENGIDLPRANTIIVIDADRLGLSTLYQLKGRVGRGNRLASAYFTYKRDSILSDVAYNRLNAISEFAEMGSGIKIAMRDLEIRGAGNILGAEQHGHMDRIGYELYSKLLKEEIEGESLVSPELDIRVDAFIPENYIGSQSARMSAYKEIAEINSLESEAEIRNGLIETFGDIPEEVDNLINIALLKLFAEKVFVSEINIKKEMVNIIFPELKSLSNGKVLTQMEKTPSAHLVASKMPYIYFDRNGKSNKEMLLFLRIFLQNIQ